MAKSKENGLLNLILNIIIPILILTKFSSPDRLGPLYGLILAVSIPLLYGLYDLLVRKKTNFISIIGLVSVLLTGGIGLVKLPVEWVAVKEAAVPLIIGLVVLFSLKTRYPLFRKLLYRKEILDIDKIEDHLEQNHKTNDFDEILRRANIYLACSFFFSSVMNYIVAKIMVHSDAGTEAFNVEIGKMAAISYPVIALPSTLIMVVILFYVIRSIKRFTGLTLEEVMVQ